MVVQRRPLHCCKLCRVRPHVIFLINGQKVTHIKILTEKDHVPYHFMQMLLRIDMQHTVLQEGLVYAVEFSHRSGRDLLNVAKKRTNIIPIIEDARHPHKYRMLVGK